MELILLPGYRCCELSPSAWSMRYPSAQLMPRLEMANAIAKQAQVAVRASKQCIRKGMQTDINTGATYEAMAFAVCFDTEDQIEGMSAFLEKRAEKHFKNK